MDKIDTDFFRLEIPLPQNPLKAVNSYVIKGPHRTLVVDTGLNRPECRRTLLEGLSALDVDPDTTDFFITHFHADHLALVASIASATSTIYMNAPDVERLMAFFDRERLDRFARTEGFPEQQIDQALARHPAVQYGLERRPAFTPCTDGDTISIGAYRLICVQTPGHSFGHMCLYDASRKYLIAGDHILGDITPNIQCWFDDWNPLALYLESLDTTYRLDVALVLPGHRNVFRDCRGRIDELKKHHAQRLEEVLAILDESPRDAYQVASRMTWDIVCDSWDRFPVGQKWFAVGEAIAHLRHLLSLRHVTREVVNGRALYARAAGRGGDPA